VDGLYIQLPDENILEAHIRDRINTFVLGTSREIIESLRKMHYNQRVLIKYYIKNDKEVEHEIEEISVGKLFELIGTDYLSCNQSKIHFHESIDDLISDL